MRKPFPAFRTTGVFLWVSALVLVAVVAPPPCRGGGAADTARGARKAALSAHTAGTMAAIGAAVGRSGTARRVPTDEVGPPFQIGVEPESAPDDQRLAAVAFDGTNYLVVWEDRRTGSTDLYCARMTSDGEVLDPSGIVISAEHNAQGTPAVAFDGTNYLVVWDDWRFSMDPNIYGARVSPDGTVIDSLDAIPISTATNGQTNPGIAFDGTNYLVVWEDWRGGTLTPDIYCTRVSPSGSVLDTAGAVVSAAAEDQTRPAVAFNGTDYVVVWEDTRSYGMDIYAARVTTAGSVLDPAGIAISTATSSQQYPSVACDGANCLVVWEDMRSDYSGDIYGARVNPSGAVLDVAGLPISPASSYQLRPSLLFAQGSYLVVWEDWRNGLTAEVYGVRLNSDGTVLDNIGMILPTGMYDYGYLDLALGFDGTNYLAVWTDFEGNLSDVTDVLGARVNASGDVLEPGAIMISAESRQQQFPAISYDGTNYLVVWGDQSSGFYSEISGRRVGKDGTLLDPKILISPQGDGWNVQPALAFGGRDYLVVWNAGGGLYGARVDTSGTVRDPAGITIRAGANSTGFPAVAFDGRNYLVVWEDNSAGFESDLYAARVDTSGTVLAPGVFPVSAQGGSEWMPAIAFDGTNYLVAWSDDRTGIYQVYAARIDTSGAILDPGGIALTSGDDGGCFPAVAFDGTQYLVVWVYGESSSGGISCGAVYGARMNTSGTVLDPAGIQLSGEGFTCFSPAVGFDGMNFLVLWTQYQDIPPHLVDVYGVRVSSVGVVLDPSGIYMGGAAFEDTINYTPTRPAVSRGPTCSMLIAYPALTPTPYGGNRIWGNKWSGPTAIAFASVTASGSGGRVTLSWEMAVDAPASSFEVWRSDSPESEFARLELGVVRGRERTFSCVDEAVVSGMTYWYRIVLAGASGGETYGPVGVLVEAAPAVFAIEPVFPNPFNPSCTIRYDVAAAGRASLRVFDVSGKVVRTLVDAWREPGTYATTWNGCDDDGHALPSGVYVCVVKFGTLTASQKTVLLR